MTETEYASAGRGGLTAYQGLARWAGVSLETVVEHAEDGRLGTLIESRQHVRPLSGREALRRLSEKRYAPGTGPKSADELVGELRARRFIWDAELSDHERQLHRGDPFWALAELRAKQVPSWWGL